MGMAIQQSQALLRPYYEGTVKCQKCEAEYDPGSQWVRGFEPSPRGSTTPEFIVCRKVEKDKCPVCLTPAQQIK